jgi:predicted RNA binding protein YcfA (HicA-like mRNA interferase family)
VKKSLNGLGHKQVIKTFQKAGWTLREGGSHAILTKEGEIARLTIPRHNPVKQFLLKGVIKTAGMTEEDFFYYLNK